MRSKQFDNLPQLLLTFRLKIVDLQTAISGLFQDNLCGTDLDQTGTLQRDVVCAEVQDC
jgi:hypothetical protein